MNHSRLLRIAVAAASIFTGAASLAASEKPAVKIMLIGDSITSGKGYCWRYHLWLKLQTHGLHNVDFVGESKDQPYLGDFDRDHEGHGGKTADEVARFAAPAIAKYQPDMAVIHLGTNDFISQKQPAAETAQEIAGIIDQLRAANPKTTIFLTKIPFVKEDQGAEMDKLAAAKTSATSRVSVIDLRSGWQFEPGNDTVDYVHPNLEGVLKITDRVFTALEPELLSRGLSSTAPSSSTSPDAPNLALGKTATADLSTPGRKPKKAVDGDWKTMWAADEKAPHWLQVDLGAPHNLTGSGVLWDSAGAAYGYKIEVSPDATNWTTVADHSSNPKEIAIALVPQKDRFTAAAVQFVRVTVTSIPNASWTKYPAAIRELQLFGTPAND